MLAKIHEDILDKYGNFSQNSKFGKNGEKNEILSTL